MSAEESAENRHPEKESYSAYDLLVFRSFLFYFIGCGKFACIFTINKLLKNSFLTYILIYNIGTTLAFDTYIYKEHIMRKKLSLFKKSSWFRLKASHCNRDSFYYRKDTTQTGQTGKLKNQGGLHHFKIDKLHPIRHISTFCVVFQSDCLAPLESP